MDFLSDNYEWVFSGIGVFIITVVGGILWRTRRPNGRNSSQNVRGSQNVQQVRGSLYHGDMQPNIQRRTTDLDSDSSQKVTLSSQVKQVGGDYFASKEEDEDA